MPCLWVWSRLNAKSGMGIPAASAWARCPMTCRQSRVRHYKILRTPMPGLGIPLVGSGVEGEEDLQGGVGVGVDGVAGGVELDLVGEGRGAGVGGVGGGCRVSA